MAFPPRVSGRPLRVLVRFARTNAGSAFLQGIARRDLGIGALAVLPSTLCGDVPLDTRPLAGRAPRHFEDAALPAPRQPWSATSVSLTEAYRQGETTPDDVVGRALAGARTLASHRARVGSILDFCEVEARREASASTQRWQRGAPLGPLDGVPLVVKEEVAVKGLPTRCGSDLTNAMPTAFDATCVARLREAGAIVIGSTPMTEYGMSPLGFNPKRAMPRNPHSRDHLAGGSSTGTAVAVATGVVPFGIGADGGGSIRIPSAHCGVFGIKPTWGRVSLQGDLLGGPGSGGLSVGHLGPIASSTFDLATFLEVTCGRDPGDLQTDLAPPRAAGSFVRALSRGVRGVRIGIDDAEWSDASNEVTRPARAALKALEAEGAVLVDVHLDLAKRAAPIGFVVISLEALASHADLLDRDAPFNPDLMLAHLGMARTSAVELMRAQRLRQGLRREVARAFGDIDLLALPTTAKTAPRVTDAEFEHGFLDPLAIDASCRFAFLANLTGLPAASAPVGTDAASLPVGLQLVGDAWDEATVFAGVAHLERIGVATVRKPPMAVSILDAV